MSSSSFKIREKSITINQIPKLIRVNELILKKTNNNPPNPSDVLYNDNGTFKYKSETTITTLAR
jgi:hypothetical protein